VSEATVSRVLNEDPRVKDETRQTVLAAARRLGREIVPDGGGTGSLPPMIGVLVPDMHNQIHAQWVERLEAALFEHGFSTLIGVRARTAGRELECLRRLSRAGAGGSIIVSGHHARQEGPVEHYREIVHAGVPLVLINGERQDLDAAFISSDEVHAIDLASTHLEALGHRRIGLAVGDERTWSVGTKVQAFARRRREAGEREPNIAFTDFSHAGGYEAARALVDKGVSAIICGSDAMAAGAIDGVRSLGSTVPEDVSVIGHDDISWAGLTTPPLTTIRQSIPLMAQSAVRALLGAGEGSRRPARTELLVQPELILRGSTAAARKRGS
jgi:DNA-binding LacI/PurR family transcriptional regulator